MDWNFHDIAFLSSGKSRPLYYTNTHTTDILLYAINKIHNQGQEKNFNSPDNIFNIADICQRQLFNLNYTGKSAYNRRKKGRSMVRAIRSTIFKLQYIL